MSVLNNTLPFGNSPQPFLTKALAYALISLGSAVIAQENTEELPEKLTNSLGMHFQRIAEEPVLICLHETRKGDFEAFVAATEHQWDNTLHFAQKNEEPAVNINLADATAFCQWLTQKERAEGTISANQLYRLPTNNEWSAAAGLGSSSAIGSNIDERLKQEGLYPWGEAWPPPEKAANLAANDIAGYQDEYRFTSPAGSFQPNEKGFYDLAGNAWEWCDDNTAQNQLNGTLRGGSWIYFRPEFLLSRFEYEVPKTLRAATFGFRCVFEDTVVSAASKRSQEQEKATMVAERSESLVGSSEDRIRSAEDSSVSDARNRLLPGREDTEGDNGNSMATISPPSLSAPHKNSIGLSFLPLTQNALLSTTEVRQKDFETFIKANSSDWPGKPSFKQTGSHPAVGVTWDEAASFCVWLTNTERQNGSLSPNQIYRLPTDSEWSLAAGIAGEAGTNPAERSAAATAIYPWGAEWPPPLGSTNLDSTKIEDFRDRSSYTSPVTDTAENSSGYFGLGGNASEWCQDTWPGGGRVIRGGSWLDSDPTAVRSGNRKFLDQTKSKSDLGFRLILSAQ